MDGVFLQAQSRQFGGGAQSDDPRRILRPAAARPFLMAAAKERSEFRSLTHIERADSLRPMQLMPGKRKEIDLRRFQIDRNLADRLHSVGMKQSACLMRETRQFFDGKQRAGLVVRPHRRDDRGLRPQRRAKGVEIDAPARVDANEMDGDAASFLQMFDERQDRGVLDGGGHDLVATLARREPGQDRRIVGFRTA